jgi:hypothetical protein
VAQPLHIDNINNAVSTAIPPAAMRANFFPCIAPSFVQVRRLNGSKPITTKFSFREPFKNAAAAVNGHAKGQAMPAIPGLMRA